MWSASSAGLVGAFVRFESRSPRYSPRGRDTNLQIENIIMNLKRVSCRFVKQTDSTLDKLIYLVEEELSILKSSGMHWSMLVQGPPLNHELVNCLNRIIVQHIPRPEWALLQ